MKVAGNSVARPGPAAGQRDDEVVGLDRQVREHHEGGEERRPQHRDDDAAVELEGARAVDLRGAHDLHVDAAQAGQEHRHDEAGGLPDGGDDDRVDRHAGILDPGEGEALPAPVLHICSRPMPGSRNHFQAVPVTMKESAIG